MDENRRSASVRMSDHLHENTHQVGDARFITWGGLRVVTMDE